MGSDGPAPGSSNAWSDGTPGAWPAASGQTFPPAWGGPAQAPPPPDGILPTLWQVVRAPTSTLRRLADAPPVGKTVGLLIAIYILNGAVLALTGEPGPSFGVDPATGEPMPGPELNWTVIALFLPLAGLAGFLLYTVVVLGLGKLFGGTASFRSLFTALAFASAPPALASLPLQAVPADRLTLALLTMPLFLALAIGSIILSVIAVREAHRLSTGTAIGVVVMMMVATIVLAFAAVLIAVAFLVGGP